jgi:hypothetical protein
MLNAGVFVLWLVSASQLIPPHAPRSDSVQRSIEEIADSGRCADLSQNPDTRVSPPRAVVPGLPPVLSFRYYEGKLHHRFENADLMLDDAGH